MTFTGRFDSYEGEYINDKKNGFGIYTFANGDYYKGNFLNDQRHGYGIMKCRGTSKTY